MENWMRKREEGKKLVNVLKRYETFNFFCHSIEEITPATEDS